MGSVEDWTDYLKGNDDPDIQKTLIHGIRTGRPAGGEPFVRLIEKLTGRDLARRKAGRPLRPVS
jgi:hypothetical protein